MSLLADLRRAAPLLLPRRSGLGPGRLAAARTLALVGVTAGYVARRPRDGWVWLPTGGLLVLTALEPALERMQPRTEALQLPGYRPAGPSAAARVLVPVGLGVVTLQGAAALRRARPGLFVAGALVQALVAAGAGAAALRAYAGRPGRTRAMRSALEAYAPELVVHTARAGALYQVQMWVPLLEALGRRYVVLTREDAALPGLASVTSAPVLARPSWRELDDAVVPSMRAAVYVNSVAANADFVTYRQLTHVYLGHGESDKALSYHPAHAMYDRVFVAGQAAVERYAANGVLMPPEKVVVVGRPQSADIARATEPVGERAAPVVLYAPTWAGYNQSTSHSSLPRALELVAALLRRPGAVVFRPHPFSRERPAERERVAAVEALLARDAAATGRAHRFGEPVGAETFAQSANSVDAMVADVSSVLVEFLASDKPMAVVAVGEPTDRFRARHPVAAAAYLVAGDLGNLDDALDDLLVRDPLRGQRAQVLQHYAGAADPAAAFRSALLEILDAGDAHDGDDARDAGPERPPRPAG